MCHFIAAALIAVLLGTTLTAAIDESAGRRHSCSALSGFIACIAGRSYIDYLDLTQAILHEDISTIETIILRNKSVLTYIDLYGRTALTFAARYGKSAAIRCLLNHGADGKHKTFSDLTAFMIAAMYGHYDAVKILMTRWGDTPFDEYDHHALDLAIIGLSTYSPETPVTGCDYHVVCNLLRNAGYKPSDDLKSMADALLKPHTTDRRATRIST